MSKESPSKNVHANRRPGRGRGRLFALALILCAPLTSRAGPSLKESDVVAWVLRQNLGIQADKLQPDIADTEITKAKSQFDTKVSGQVFYNLDRSDKETIVLGTDTREVLYEAKVEKKFPLGAEGAIRLTNIHNTTNSAFATDPSFFDTSIHFDVQAPFLKNRFGKSDRLTVDLSRQQKKTVEAQTLNEVQNEVARAVRQYWNWVASKEYESLARGFLKLARDFQGGTEKKKTLGLAEEVDLYGTQALVTEREAELLRAKNLYEDLRKGLLYTLNMDLEDPIRSGEVLGVPAITWDQASAMELALRLRPDYRALIEAAKSKDIQIALAQDQKWPSLDLFTSLELNSVDPAYGEALKQTFSAQHPDWLIGARFNLALENRLAKSQLKKNQLEKIQALLGIKDLENAIALEIDERLRELALQRQEYR